MSPIHDVRITPLRRIPDERGAILHMLRRDDPGFEAFGEIYFSLVYPGVIKGWHLHARMTLNYAVPVGMIKLVCFDERAGLPQPRHPAGDPPRRAPLRPGDDSPGRLERLHRRGDRRRPSSPTARLSLTTLRRSTAGTPSRIRFPMTGRCVMAETAVPVPATEALADRFAFTGSLRARAARGTVVNTAFSVGLGLLTLVKGFVLAGFLSRRDYGIWGVIAVSLSSLLFFKQAGIGDRFVQQAELDQEAAFQTALTLELIVTGACVALIAVAVPVLVLVYDLPQLAAPSAVIAVALLVSVFQAPLWIYYRRMEFARQRALQAVDPVVGFVVSVALAIAGTGYWAFVGGLAAGACAASAVAVWRSPFRVRLRWQAGALRAAWSFSGPLLVAGAAGAAMAWSASLAAKLDLGVAAVGVITLAYTISSFTDRVDQLVTGALYPAICAVRDRTDVLYESLVKSNRLALMWAVPFGLAVTLFSADLVRFVIGERWHAAIVVLQVSGVTAAVNHVGFNWSAYFRALGRTRPLALETVAAAAVFIIVGIPLLIADGLPGFAAGIAAQAVAALAMRTYWLRRLFPGFHFLGQAARAFAPTLPATALVLVARILEPGSRTAGGGHRRARGLRGGDCRRHPVPRVRPAARGVRRAGAPGRRLRVRRAGPLRRQPLSAVVQRRL